MTLRATLAFLTLGALILGGAGCARTAPPPSVPAFIEDAKQFEQPSRVKIPRTLPAYRPAPPVAKPPLTYPKSAVEGVDEQHGPAAPEYVEALAKYRSSGAYFQIVNCRGTPGTMTLKRGVVFMVDNRDNADHRIGVGNRSYDLGPYGFIIVSAATAGISNITCDGGGAAQIRVQP